MIKWLKNKCPWVFVRKSEYDILVGSLMATQCFLEDEEEVISNITNYLNTLNGKTASVSKLKRILED